MKRVFLVCLSAALAAQAVGVQKDKVAVSEKVTGIVVSAKLNPDLSSEYFGYFDITMENKSDRWLTLSKVKVTFPDNPQKESIRFITGRDFTLWQAAMTKIISLKEANEKTAMAVVGALGYGLASLSGNEALRTAGTAAYAGAAGAYGIQQYGNWKDSLERAKMFPDNHLMGDTIRVLPGLFVDRWLLVNSSQHDSMPYLTRMLIEVETTDGRQETFTLDFRAKRDQGVSKWQRSIYKRLYPVESQPCTPGYMGC